MATKNKLPGSKDNPLLKNLVTVNEYAEMKNVRTATIYSHVNSPDKPLEATYVGKNASIMMIDTIAFKDYKFAVPKFKFSEK